ncbi:MAG: aldo/keto reductase [Pelagibacterales bacterium]|nr:aldo/keto reductase [Pelagibacterales bacterium]OUU63421.1 MAG: aldo/keto reductase [Alphaproteobacteria bacterium TMED62]|tara:strand:- start:415 stop:1461 length:1047 start_codon:yes stop_codon:yes gene_type:complete
MEFRYLGKSDLKVSSYCLGTMTYGETTKESDAHLQINEAISAGINFIDTAEMYPTCPIRKETSGRTEEIIGNWINDNKLKRKEIILATKVVGNGFKYIRDGGPITQKVIKVALQDSLKRLKTDYVDLYQLHWPNRGSYHFRSYWNYIPVKQDNNKIKDENLGIINALVELKKEGLVRAIGVSNETCWGVMKLNEIIKETQNLCIASIQNEYSLMCRLFDNDFNELSINENIPLLAYSPLARGLLTGKYIGNKIPKGSRLSRDDKIRKIVNENSDLAVSAYSRLAQKYNIDPIHMSLAFCNERPFMGSVIFGATNILQLKKILVGINLKLNSEINSEIQALYKKFPLTF